MPARSSAFARAGLVAALVLGLDQLTKHTLAAGIAQGQEKRFLPGIHLVHVRNTGVAFSLFSGGGTVVLLLTLAALVALIGYLWLRPGRRGLWIPTGMLVGGALGNLIDRLRQGYVVDFIAVKSWPVFNIADSCIVVGVIILAYHLLVVHGSGDHGTGNQ